MAGVFSREVNFHHETTVSLTIKVTEKESNKYINVSHNRFREIIKNVVSKGGTNKETKCGRHITIKRFVSFTRFHIKISPEVIGGRNGGW